MIGKSFSVACVAAMMCASTAGFAQAAAPAAPVVNMSVQVEPFFNDWHNAKAHRTHDALEERDMLTRGDVKNPPAKGAVLRYMNSVTYATLAAGATTGKASSENEQVWFVTGGMGTLQAGGQSYELKRNIAVMLGSKTEFTLRSTGKSALTFYAIYEGPSGASAGTVKVVDENKLPITTTERNWSEIVKPVFTGANGLTNIDAIETVTLDPLTTTRPYLVQGEQTEEFWIALEGNGLALLNNQLRRLPAGAVFLHKPDDSPASTFNPTPDTQLRMLHVLRRADHSGN